MSDSAKQYTAFWPVFIVFFVFTLMGIWNLVLNIQGKSQLEAAVAQLHDNAVKAQMKEAALSGLAQDLVTLAPTSLVAQQIVTDFRIQIKNPPPRQGAASGSTSAAPAPATTTNAPAKQ